jgi:hypothetical protein
MYLSRARRDSDRCYRVATKAHGGREDNDAHDAVATKAHAVREDNDAPRAVATNTPRRPAADPNPPARDPSNSKNPLPGISSEKVTMPTREGEVDPVKGLSLEPEVFLEAHARRQKALQMQDLIRPGRTRPLAIRFDEFTVTRLRALAAMRNTGYQTLLKEFVIERLYEEERRAGIIEPHPRAS